MQDIRRDPLAGADLGRGDDFELTAEQQTALDAVTTALKSEGEYKGVPASRRDG